MLDPKVRDVIQQTRDLIAAPEHWCTGAFARRRGKMIAMSLPIGVSAAPVTDALYLTTLNVRYEPPQKVDPRSPLADEWCFVGALQKVADITPLRQAALRLLGDVALRLYPDVDRHIGTRYVVGPHRDVTTLEVVNDALGHEAVLAVCDKVLADETVA